MAQSMGNRDWIAPQSGATSSTGRCAAPSITSVEHAIFPAASLGRARLRCAQTLFNRGLLGQ